MAKNNNNDRRIEKAADFLDELAHVFQAGAMMAHSASVAVSSFQKLQEAFQDHQEELEKQYDLMEERLHD